MSGDVCSDLDGETSIPINELFSHTHQTWLDDCTALVGEENAEAAFEKLSSMVTGDVYGEDAVEAYANGGGAYFCGFTNDLATLTFDGETSTISGTDKDGNELFSHTYHYIGMEPVRGLYEFDHGTFLHKNYLKEVFP